MPMAHGLRLGRFEDLAVHRQCKVAVFGRCFNGLLELWRKLNGLGVFSVSVQSSTQALLERLEAGERFNALFFDGFDLDRDDSLLETIAKYQAFDLLVLLADVNSVQRQQLFQRTHERAMAHVQVLPLPVRAEDLALVVELHPACGQVGNLEPPTTGRRAKRNRKFPNPKLENLSMGQYPATTAQGYELKHVREYTV
ncbi:hypothetical protein KSS89_15295 [Pseudomonas sessilinigenes]|uniref:Uncharacterized protein n=1 Tax=Pseudomonas sessilinigenes TaxID=658629 RepID=A0ABX8MYB1_9PSED|nr:hypothetical protein [Pseudomonas sessilinigenes]QXH43530.1 hypothetical protein KSS89_15295 [Pseudomonas sessilinigenes]